MKYTTASEGRACDALVDGPANGTAISVDGLNAPLLPGETIKFWTGDIATIVRAEGLALRLDRAVSVPDNCGIWKA